MPESVFLAVGAYETQDGGNLQFQIPSGNGDGNIDISEFYELIVNGQGILLGDLNFDGMIDMMDFAVFTTHWMEINCNAVNNWCGGADLNHINDVDIEDLAEFASFWLNQ